MSKELITQPSAEALNALAQAFPTDPGFNRIMLPRLTFKSQDVTEGKGKNMKVVMEAGTFIEERETDELNEEGKKVWSKEDLGTEIEGVIIFQRKQLRYFDEATEEYTSSPAYDGDEEVVPLFTNKKEIAKGTPKELKEKYQYTDKDGKIKSRLEENRLLFILKGDELFQLNLRGSSMYSFLGYARKTLVPSVLTVMNSEPKEKGSIEWNQMTFTPKRTLGADEVATVLEKIDEIKRSIMEEKAYFASQNAATATALPGADKDDF